VSLSADRASTWRAPGIRDVAACAMALIVLTAPGCGRSEENEVRSGSSTSTEVGERAEIDRQVSTLDALLIESIESIGLNPSDGRREIQPNPCIGAEGNEGYNIRFYYAEPDRTSATAYLRDLEQNWKAQDDIEVTSSVDFDPLSLVALSEDFALESKWFAGSEELSIGGSTECLEKVD
jgi:hypothetical protein